MSYSASTNLGNFTPGVLNPYPRFHFGAEGLGQTPEGTSAPYVILTDGNQMTPPTGLTFVFHAGNWYDSDDTNFTTPVFSASQVKSFGGAGGGLTTNGGGSGGNSLWLAGILGAKVFGVNAAMLVLAALGIAGGYAAYKWSGKKQTTGGK